MVSVSVCGSVREHISGTTLSIFTNFFVCVIYMAMARYSSGGVALRHVLPFFMNDVTFAHNGK